MPRKSRIDISGAIHHVIVRGIERRKIFLNDSDRGEFIRRLSEALERTQSQCYAWCLIPNHFHLLIRTGVNPLSTLMRSLLTGYAIYFNKKYKRHGYLYQNRYKSILCQEEVYFLELIRYIHLNPIRSRLVETLPELDRYKWSGHSVLVGKQKHTWQEKGEVLVRFSTKKSIALQRYREFIREGLYMGRREDLTGGGLRRSAGGWREVEMMRRRKEYWRGDERILGDGSFVERVLEKADQKFEKQERLKRKGWNLNKLAEKVSQRVGIDKKELSFKTRTKDVARARRILAYLAYIELGISGIEISRFLNISRPAVSKAINAGKREKISNRLIS